MGTKKFTFQKFNIVLFLCSLALFFSGCCEDGVRTEAQTLEKDEWIGALNATFNGVSLRLNNYTPEEHYYSAEDVSAFYKPDDRRSFLLMIVL